VTTKISENEGENFTQPDVKCHDRTLDKRCCGIVRELNGINSLCSLALISWSSIFPVMTYLQDSDHIRRSEVSAMETSSKFNAIENFE
jgi:hypothetical protein